MRRILLLPSHVLRARNDNGISPIVLRLCAFPSLKFALQLGSESSFFVKVTVVSVEGLMWKGSDGSRGPLTLNLHQGGRHSGNGFFESKKHLFGDLGKRISRGKVLRRPELAMTGALFQLRRLAKSWVQVRPFH